jgi:hypothetical protein
VTTKDIPNGVAFNLSGRIVGLELINVTPGPGGLNRPLPQD